MCHVLASTKVDKLATKWWLNKFGKKKLRYLALVFLNSRIGFDLAEASYSLGWVQAYHCQWG